MEIFFALLSSNLIGKKLEKAQTREVLLKGRLSTVDLLVLTNLD